MTSIDEIRINNWVYEFAVIAEPKTLGLAHAIMGLSPAELEELSNLLNAIKAACVAHAT